MSAWAEPSVTVPTTNLRAAEVLRPGAEPPTRAGRLLPAWPWHTTFNRRGCGGTGSHRGRGFTSLPRVPVVPWGLTHHTLLLLLLVLLLQQALVLLRLSLERRLSSPHL